MGNRASSAVLAGLLRWLSLFLANPNVFKSKLNVNQSKIQNTKYKRNIRKHVRGASRAPGADSPAVDSVLIYV